MSEEWSLDRIYCDVCGTTIEKEVLAPRTQVPTRSVAKPCGHLIARDSPAHMPLLVRSTVEHVSELQKGIASGLTDEWYHRYCTHCKEEGREKQVQWYVTDTLVVLKGELFFDNEGRYHDHSTDTFLTIHCCEYGHRQLTVKRKGCPNCPKGIETVEIFSAIDEKIGHLKRHRDFESAHSLGQCVIHNYFNSTLDTPNEKGLARLASPTTDHNTIQPLYRQK